MQRTVALCLLSLTACITLTDAQRSREETTRAAALKSKNRLLEAAQAYSDALDADPKNLLALRGYIETQHLVGQTGPVINRFKGAVAAHPADAYAHEGLGLALFTAGGEGLEQARAELNRATELAPDVADFQYRLGLFYVEGDRFPEAIGALTAAVKLDGRNARYRLPYALALARTGDRAGAVVQLRAVLNLTPNADEVALAEKTARNLIDPFRAFPRAAREQWEIALNYLDHDSTNQAKQVLESLLQKYPDIAIVHALLGLTAAKGDDASLAIVELRKAIELDPALAEPRLYLGDIYSSHGSGENAQSHYEAALERNPFLADAYKRLAEIHAKANDPEGTAAMYRIYLLLRPRDVDALLANAKLLSDRHSPDAAAAWDNAVATYPTRVDVLIPRGRYYFEAAARTTKPAERAQFKTEAAKSLEKALDMDPENASATSLLAELRRIP
jgi:tetratricopeptide (TPR) repeat protein